MTESSRRSFLVAGAAALSAGHVMGANEKANIGIVGIGGRGNDHIKAYATLPEVRIVALCDVNQASLERGQAAVKSLTGESPKGYDDMRKMFADKGVDAVSITTPNHWHALATIWACQAEKDVYCEKPACYNVHEGERMIEVARKTGRMVQIGSQSRSMLLTRHRAAGIARPDPPRGHLPLIYFFRAVVDGLCPWLPLRSVHQLRQ
jgi:hypothetical protein